MPRPTYEDLVEALRSFVEWAEEHRDACKRAGARPAIDAHRVSRARKLVDAAPQECDPR